MNEHYDIAFLGGGPAGYQGAIRAAQLGAKVAVIEEKFVGGVCLNRGCIPTKAVRASAEVARSMRRAREYGFKPVETGALPAPLNMAIDEALLQLHVPGESRPTLRFYRWSPPAVSLGYFQKRHSIDLSAYRELGLGVVRRATGGRAVLHEDDLTYSVVADSRQGIPSSLDAAYRLLCEGLLTGFRLLGFEAELGREKAGAPQSDICLVRAAIGDIVHQGRKFAGSAQTWRGACLLQHGSIILEPQEKTWAAIIKTDTQSRDSLREKLKSRTVSLREILGRKIEPSELKSAIKAGMAEALQVELQAGELSPKEWAHAREIASGKTPLEGSHEYSEKLSAIMD